MSCSDVPGQDFDVPAALYIESLCEQRCEAETRCNPEEAEDHERCMTGCVALTDEEMTGTSDVCFERFVETSRCRYERLTCEDIFLEPGQALNDPVVGPCVDAWAAWVECLEQSL